MTLNYGPGLNPTSGLADNIEDKNYTRCTYRDLAKRRETEDSRKLDGGGLLEPPPSAGGWIKLLLHSCLYFAL